MGFSVDGRTCALARGDAVCGGRFMVLGMWVAIFLFAVVKAADVVTTLKAFDIGLRESWGRGAVKLFPLPGFVRSALEWLTDKTVGRLGSKPSPGALVAVALAPLAALIVLTFFAPPTAVLLMAAVLTLVTIRVVWHNIEAIEVERDRAMIADNFGRRESRTKDAAFGSYPLPGAGAGSGQIPNVFDAAGKPGPKTIKAKAPARASVTKKP